MIFPLLARNVTAEMQASKEKSTPLTEFYTQIADLRRAFQDTKTGWTLCRESRLRPSLCAAGGLFLRFGSQKVFHELGVELAGAEAGVGEDLLVQRN
jgi:hypothetical protein